MVDELIQLAKEYLPQLNEKRLRHAFDFAKKAHTDQLRKDGKTPYIEHPFAAAKYLCELRVDEDTLIAALLHDVPEDTDCSLKDVEKGFGKTVAFLVDGITKLSKVHYRHDMAERQIESLKKLFIHSARDPRIILIKLADRLHNMSTIDAIPDPEKRIRIAKETFEIYVPIANLLGVWEVKNKLEDLCFKTLAPKDFKMIDKLVRNSALKKKDLANRTVKDVEKLLKKHKIPCLRVEGRQKTYYSTFRKMLHSGKSFSEIYDLVGLRIIVPNVGLCYQTLGIVHQRFTPKIGRLKDFIALPKSNGYQSIHTSVFGIDGTITEVQIRTEDMHLENEYGIAAHYFYREAQDRKQQTVRKKLKNKYAWVSKILDLQRNAKDNKKFFKHLKLDIFTDRIFVFTPKGDVVDLPRGSTVIDFAYHIHSDVGMLANGALINGKDRPLTGKLSNGDVVNVKTSEEAEGPQVEWLNVVRTTLARNRIREFLREKDKATLITEAEKLLDNKLQAFAFGGVSDLSKLQRVVLMEHFKVDSWEDLLLEVGDGSIDARDVIKLIYSDEDLLGEKHDPDNQHVYDHTKRRRIKEILPEKVRTLSLFVKAHNRVGVLGDMCREFANSNVNIVEASAASKSVDVNFSLVKFIVDIEDFEQYEKVLYGLKKIPGVISVTQLSESVLNPLDEAVSVKDVLSQKSESA
jgi:GTP diphosphokinase / guanosine-3',5'-bis(diphosphate) 3'-diphosphatase